MTAAEDAVLLGYCPTCMGSHRVAHKAPVDYFGAPVYCLDPCPTCVAKVAADTASINRTIRDSLAAVANKLPVSPFLGGAAGEGVPAGLAPADRQGRDNNNAAT